MQAAAALVVVVVVAVVAAAATFLIVAALVTFALTADNLPYVLKSWLQRALRDWPP